MGSAVCVGFGGMERGCPGRGQERVRDWGPCLMAATVGREQKRLRSWVRS